MKELVCNMGHFTYKHPIYLYGEGENTLLATVPTDEVIYMLFNCAQECNVFKIHFFGDINYIKPYGEALISKFTAEYANQDFQVLFN